MTVEKRLRGLASQESSLGKTAKDDKDRLAAMTDDQLFSEREVLVAQANVLAADYNKLKRKIVSIKDELRRRKDPEAPVISDHAVLRYLERHVGVDTVAVRKTIAELARKRIAEKQTQIVEADGLNLAMRDNRVCTLWPTEEQAEAP